MGVKLVSASAGSVEIVAPATASNYTATMPAGSGTVAVNGVSGTLVSGTAVASTSGTSIDFTGIPSWVKRITVVYNGFSTNGSSVPIIQLGAGSPTTSGYLGSASQQSGSGVSVNNFTTGCAFCNTVGAATTQRGIFTCVNLSGNVWVISGTGAWSDNTVTTTTSSGVTLSGTLDRVRITTINGTDTFDAGNINILYE